MNWKRDRPFSYVTLQWTDTGERPWWWCWLLAVLLTVTGMSCVYNGDVPGAVFFLLGAGYNIGVEGMVDKRKVGKL